MKLKELESWLTQCDVFEHPKVTFEQYPTSAHVAARMLYSAQEYIEGSTVCDLGSGCGVLSIGARMLEAGLVYGFEIDPDATEIALKNVHEIFDDDNESGVPIEFIQCKIGPDFKQGPDALSLFESFFDVVIMNPPFGTKNNSGADFGFLQRAVHLVKPGGHIYSLHKTSTRKFFQKKLSSSLAELDYEVQGEVLAQIRYDLPKCYKFHKEKTVDIEVDFWHFHKK